MSLEINFQTSPERQTKSALMSSSSKVHSDSKNAVSRSRICETLFSLRSYLLHKRTEVHKSLQENKKILDNKLHVRSLTEEYTEFSDVLEKLHALLTLGLPAEKIWLYIYQQIQDEFSADPLGVGYELSTTQRMLFLISSHIRQGYRAGESAEYGIETLASGGLDSDFSLQPAFIGRDFHSARSGYKRMKVDQWKLWNLLNPIKQKRRIKALTYWQELARCWKFSDEYGIPLAELILVFQKHIQMIIDLEHKKRIALSGPLMTMRITLLLPLLALVMTTMIGLDTFPTLFFTFPGWICLAVAAVAIYCAYRWSRAMITKVVT